MIGNQAAGVTRLQIMVRAAFYSDTREPSTRRMARFAALLAGGLFVWGLLTPMARAAPPTHPALPDLSRPERQRACGVATDPAGRLYVSEQTTKTVSIFAPDGSQTPITSFTTTADLAANPCHIAVDSTGAVYVVSSGRTQATKYVPSAYPPTGTTTYAADPTINGNGKLAFGGTFDVNSVAVDPVTDNVYLATDAGPDVQEYDNPTENYKLEFNSTLTAELTPTSTLEEIREALRTVACGGEACVNVVAGTPATRIRITFAGTLTNSDQPAVIVVKTSGNVPTFEMFSGAATDHVVKYAPNGTPLSKTIGSGVAGAEYLGVDVYGKNGNIYLTNKAGNKALVLNNAGDTVLADFNGSDSLAGAFAFTGPALPDIAVDQSNGHAFVVDIRDHAVVSEFDGAGNFVSQISHSPAFQDATPSTVTVDGGASSPNKGVIYLSAHLGTLANAGVFAFGPLSTPIHLPRDDLSRPERQRACGVATDPAGRLYVSEQTTKTVSIFAPDGSQTPITSFTTTADLAANPCHIAVDSTGAVYVVSSGRTQATKYVPSAYPPTGTTTYAADPTINGNGKLAFGGTFDVNSVAVDPVTDNVYLATDAGPDVQEYDNPTENYKLEFNSTLTAELTPTSTLEEIREALRTVACGGEACVNVVAGTPATRIRITFAGTLTNSDQPAVIVVKTSGNVPTFEMFSGAATDHVVKYAPNGTPLSKTIGSGVAGAEYLGVDVYGKNGNIYLTNKAGNKALVLNNAGDTVLADFNGSDSLAGAFAFTGPALPDIAVDQSNGHAFVVDIRDHAVVSEFDGAGNFVSQISHSPAFQDATPSTVTVDGGASSPNKGVIYLSAHLGTLANAGVFAFGPLSFAFPLEVTKTGQGSGTVTSTPAGISCGATCEAEFEADSLVKLSADPAFGSAFGAWSGCDNVVDEECEVTMSDAREVSVRFDSRPVVSDQASSQITDSSARLEAKINPKGKATTYNFEYLTEEAWLADGESFSGAEPATKGPASPLAIGSGTTTVAAAIKVDGLEPLTTYHFRAVATNDIGTAEGERDPGTDEEIERSFTTYASPEIFTDDCPDNEDLRTGASENLPDCRAWEQASPVDKNGGSIQGTAPSSRTTEDGSTITFESTTGVSGGSGSQDFPTYLAKRDDDSSPDEDPWATTGLLPDPSSGQRARVLGWTPDFSTVFDQADLLGQGGSMLARETSSGAQTQIVPHTLPAPLYSYLGTSTDGTTVIFEASPQGLNTLQLTPDAAAGKPNVYAWNRTESGELRLAGVLPDGTTPPEGSRAAGGSGGYNQDTHLVGPDGSVFFNDREDGQLYLRLNPDAEETEETDEDGNCVPDEALACTVHISASQKENGIGPEGTDSAGPQAASFMAANPEGSVITFTSSEKLTNDANTGPEPDAPAIARAKASDGGEKNLEFIPAFAREIAIDEVEGYVYWSDPANGRIGRAKLDGTDFNASYIIDPDEPIGIGVIDEPTAKYIFWTERGELDADDKPQASLGTIGRADLDGTNVNQDCLTGLTNPRSIAVRPDFIYWTSPTSKLNSSGNVVRASLTCNEASKTILITNEASGDIAVDASHIYFAFSTGVNGFIRRYNLDGTEAGAGGAGDDPIVQIPGAESPLGLALDDSYLYWSNPTAQKVGRSDLGGTDASEEPEFITQAGRIEDLARADEYLYWTANQNLAPNPGTDIYQLDLRGDKPKLTDLAPDSVRTNGAEVQGVLGTSKDGSYIYFAANGVSEGLGGSPNENDENAEPGNCKGTGDLATGTCNLYVAHAGQVDFVARLNAGKPSQEKDAGDAINWIAGRSSASKLESDKSARVSPDGLVLVFRSRRQLTEYDNQGPQCVEGIIAFTRAPGPCLEFYRFDYGKAGLTCLTCNPRGVTPGGPARLASVRPPSIGTLPGAATLGRNLSQDGDRFFFETPDALVAEDTNGGDNCPAWGGGDQKQSSRACQDVYEWEASEAGSCKEDSPAYSPLNEGCIYLISTGKGKEATFFADADLDGDNVFVFTYEQLVPQDKDALLDAYDARVGGGSAFQHQPPEEICDNGETCKAPPSTPPATQTPGSSGFAGPSDPEPKRAHKKKKRKHAKHKKKRGSKAKQNKAKKKQRAAGKSRGAGR